MTRCRLPRASIGFLTARSTCCIEFCGAPVVRDGFCARHEGGRVNWSIEEDRRRNAKPNGEAPKSPP